MEKGVEKKPIDNNDPVFSSLEWSTNLDLPPGTILKFSHDLTDISYLFECTDLTGGKYATGVLIELFRGEEVATKEATITTIHPNPYMAQQNTRYVQFAFREDDKYVKVTPAFSKVERAHSPELAQKIFDEEVNKR